MNNEDKTLTLMEWCQSCTWGHSSTHDALVVLRMVLEDNDDYAFYRKYRKDTVEDGHAKFTEGWRAAKTVSKSKRLMVGTKGPDTFVSTTWFPNRPLPRESMRLPIDNFTPLALVRFIAGGSVALRQRDSRWRLRIVDRDDLIKTVDYWTDAIGTLPTYEEIMGKVYSLGEMSKMNMAKESDVQALLWKGLDSSVPGARVMVDQRKEWFSVR